MQWTAWDLTVKTRLFRKCHFNMLAISRQVFTNVYRNNEVFSRFQNVCSSNASLWAEHIVLRVNTQVVPTTNQKRQMATLFLKFCLSCTCSANTSCVMGNCAVSSTSKVETNFTSYTSYIVLTILKTGTYVPLPPPPASCKPGWSS